MVEESFVLEPVVVFTSVQHVLDSSERMFTLFSRFAQLFGFVFVSMADFYVRGSSSFRASARVRRLKN